MGARGRRWSRTGEPLLSELAGRGHLRNRGPDHAGLLPALDSRTPLETLLLRLETLWSLQCWPHKGLDWFFRWRGGPCSCLSKRHYSSDILILPLDILLPQHRAVSLYDRVDGRQQGLAAGLGAAGPEAPRAGRGSFPFPTWLLGDYDLDPGCVTCWASGLQGIRAKPLDLSRTLFFFPVCSDTPWCPCRYRTRAAKTSHRSVKVEMFAAIGRQSPSRHTFPPVTKSCPSVIKGLRCIF